VSQAADQGGGREDDETGNEDPAATEQVGHPASQEQEAAVGEDVPVDDPLQALLREPRSRLIDGRAMLRIEASRTSMNWTRQSRIRIATPRLDDRDVASGDGGWIRLSDKTLLTWLGSPS
jgi:hypothetical protein